MAPFRDMNAADSV